MAGVTPRSGRSFFGSGMVGQTFATANGIAQAIERNRPVAPAKSIGPPSVSTSGGTTTYTAPPESGTISVEVPAGVYAVTGTHTLTLSDDVVDQFIGVEIAESYESPISQSTSASVVAGTPISCTVSGTFVVPAASTFTLTPTLVTGSGGGSATSEESTLRATRIADA
jgi:hypothetical protein